MMPIEIMLLQAAVYDRILHQTNERRVGSTPKAAPVTRVATADTN